VEEQAMSVLLQERSSRHYLHPKCRCGRELRAKLEQAGSEIICWDCHAPVRVPIPAAPGGWVARLLKMGARQLIEARTCTLLVIGAAIVTSALTLPHLVAKEGPSIRWLSALNPGIWLAGLALGLVMIGYGELLRRGSEGDWTVRHAPRLGTRIWRGVVCLGAGMALVLPLILASSSRTIPRATLPGLAIAAILTLMLPLVMLATYSGHSTIRARLAMIREMFEHHPVAVFASILILPMAIIAIEAALCTLIFAYRPVSFFLLDLCPQPPLVEKKWGVPYVWNQDFRVASDSAIMDVYADQLRHGYSLIGAIPASLAMETSNGFEPYTISLSRSEYLQARILFTLFIVSVMLAVLAVQARWLGLLSTMDTRRTAATNPMPLVAALPNLRPTL
jgi:hypothetical protein